LQAFATTYAEKKNSIQMLHFTFINQLVPNLIINVRTETNIINMKHKNKS